jgi:hypothetical protein
VFVSGNYVYIAAFGISAYPTGDNSLSIFNVGALFPRLLVDEVETLVAAGVLNKGQGNALVAKLEAAIKKLQEGDVNAAANQLQAFINQVNALINGGVLSLAQGEALIDSADAVITQIDG